MCTLFVKAVSSFSKKNTYKRMINSCLRAFSLSLFVISLDLLVHAYYVSPCIFQVVSNDKMKATTATTTTTKNERKNSKKKSTELIFVHSKQLLIFFFAMLFLFASKVKRDLSCISLVENNAWIFPFFFSLITF